MTLKRIYFLIPLLLFFVLPNISFADTVNFSQPTFNATTRNFASTTPSNPWLTQQLGTGLSGTVRSFSIWSIKTLSTAGSIDGASFTWSFAECSTVNCSAGSSWSETGNVDLDSQSVGTAYENNFVFSQTRSLDPAKYYIFSFIAKSGENFTDNNVIIEGSTANDWTGSSCTYPFGSSPASGVCDTASPVIQDIKFYAYGDNVTNSPSVWNVNPANASTTASTRVSVYFNYFAPTGSGVTHWNASIYDTGASGNFPIASSTVSLQGNATLGSNQAVNTFIVLNSGHTYRMRVYLTDASDVSYLSALPTTFSVILSSTTPGFYGNFQASTTLTYSSENCTPATSILDVGGGVSYALCYLFTPSGAVFDEFASLSDLFSNKFPFSYISSLSDVVDTLSGQSAVVTPNASYTLPLNATFTNPANGSTTTSITMWSPSAIVTAYPFLATLRTYMGYFIYLMFSLYAFRSIIKLI